MAVYRDHPQHASLRLHGERLLLISPHPDDEVLAAAGLLQQACSQGRQVHIWQFSDGETNPWPQRVQERRLRIRAIDRARWGARRNNEARAGLAELQVPEVVLECLHWEDMGLNARIRTRLDESVRLLAQRLQALRPHVLVMPSLADRHPDHSATHVLMGLALYRAGLLPQVLGYTLHGTAKETPSAFTVRLDARMREAKRAAIMQHRSQMVFGQQRMLVHVRERETFMPVVTATACGPSVHIPWPMHRTMAGMVRLILASPTRSWTWRGSDAPLSWDRKDMTLHLPQAAIDAGPLYLRMECPWRSAWIFDRWGWAPLTTAK
ncbi:PIG-L family deacetylase [Oleiagrimonas sp.]|jgi:LmbE family N-acetylglucosaminyl deacetylase|uniref:PIG-L deacetylase family protein n=1 Tax=Oleiagrimonas sp. TaxID=2010330 RepID=UPI0026343721|nr:PIG-L family deacetylase [Oleiagrimonas sp.]MDA3914923.1 PIG-L family deacetylase [Oleiagrimonas sp.]